MAIDTSIYANLLRAPKTVAEYDAEAVVGQQNRLALQTEQMKMDEYQRSVSDRNRLRQVVAGFGTDKGANYNALLKAGRLPDAQKYAKENADIGKIESDAKENAARTAKLDLEAVGIASQQHKDMLGAVNDPQTAAQWVAAAYNDPRMAAISSHGGTLEQAIARIPTDPKAFAEWKMQSSLGADKLIEYTRANANTVATNATSTANNAATNATSRANNASTNATTQRGQNMSDARTRETLGAAKIPPGYRANKDGSLSFIPGGPADPTAGGGKPPTEFQGKSAAFGARAEQADKILTGLTGKYNPAAINAKTAVEDTWLIGGGLAAAANNMLSAEGQKAEQAQRDFINAVLRQESGAAIGASEFDNARKQYFPQPGDSKEVISQKAANRKLSVQGLKSNAGKAAFSAPPAEDIHAAADAILNGGK